jgi:hypothetical protein
MSFTNKPTVAASVLTLACIAIFCFYSAQVIAVLFLQRNSLHLLRRTRLQFSRASTLWCLRATMSRFSLWRQPNTRPSKSRALVLELTLSP